MSVVFPLPHRSRPVLGALVVAMICWSVVSPAAADAPADDAPTAAAMSRLTQGTRAEKEAVVAEIKAHAERYAPPAFYALAASQFSAGAKDDAVFWLYAGQLRARCDTKLWQEESAGEVVATLNQTYGVAVIAYAFSEVAKLGDTLQTVADWDARTPHHYDRGWIGLPVGGATEPAGSPRAMLAPEQWAESDRRTRTKYLQEFRRATGGDAADYFSDPQLVLLANAARAGDVATIDRLVAAGVDVNRTGRDGATVLWFPFRAYNKPGYRRLLELGANPNLPLGRWKDTVLATAAERNDPEYLALVLDHGLSPNAVTPDTHAPIIFKTLVPGALPSLKLLLARGAAMDPRNGAQDTPLLAAATVNQYEQVAALIAAGADVRLKNSGGCDLAYFLYNGAMNAERRQRRAEVVALLKQKGMRLPVLPDDRDRPTVKTFADAAALAVKP